jgi:NAD(P)-dependent dehydrogenase (short-subunit alcohol dehydrogenase family)
MAGERKVAIVTGAASGIGRAMALGLLKAGIDVAGVDRDAAGLEALKGGPGTLRAIAADLSDPASFDQIVAMALGISGRIDVLVNNAGIGQASVKADSRANPLRFWEITPEQWSRFVAVNATAPLMMARAVAPHMMKAGTGRIVTVTTSLGTMIRGGYVLYGGSKASAEATAAIMAADLAGTGVTVNVLVPGGVTDTAMVQNWAFTSDRSKMIRPEVMVPPLLWLISDEAAGVTARRFLGVHWDPKLPPAEAAERAGAPIAWTSIATMPIEPT